MLPERELDQLSMCLAVPYNVLPMDVYCQQANVVNQIEYSLFHAGTEGFPGSGGCGARHRVHCHQLLGHCSSVSHLPDSTSMPVITL